MTLLILNIGTFHGSRFSEKILLLYNPLTYPTADVITTHTCTAWACVSNQLQLRRGDSGCSKA